MVGRTILSLRGISRARIACATDVIAPLDTAELPDLGRNIVCLVDNTNLGIVLRIRKLGVSLRHSFPEPAFEVLCDYMGYYFYDALGLWEFIERQTECALFADEVEFRAFIEPVATTYIRVRCYDKRIPFDFIMRVDDLWKWMLGRPPFTDPYVIVNPLAYGMHHNQWVLDMKHLKLTMEEIERTASTYSGMKLNNNMKLQILAVFREAAGWPSFTL